MSSIEKTPGVPTPRTPTPRRPSSRASMRSVRASVNSPIVPKEPPSQNPIAKLDRVISRLTIILSTPAGTDSLLRTITYTLQFLVCGLQNIMENHLSTILGLVVSINQFKSKIFPPKPRVPGTKGVGKKSGGGSSLLPTIMKAVPRAGRMSSLISDFRTFTRIWGLLGMYAWGKSLIFTPPKDMVLRLIGWGQCISYIFYQGYENRAYLAGKKIWSKRDGKDITADWLWSSRMWMVAVGLEFVRLFRVRQLWNTNTMSIEEEKKERATWRREFIANCANAPLTLHWSVEGGKLGDTSVGFLGMIGGYVGLSERWRAAGEQLGL
jgi:hypothetical protein